MKHQCDPKERALADSYDVMPYAGNPYYHTHPGVLAAYGVLYGLSPCSPERSQVLELGCGDGSNIIPMAYDFPHSRFTGIDLSKIQIDIGRKNIDALDLKNICLETRSIMDMGAADGKFDYIIVHGVYSWVPEAVRKKILDICKNNLCEQGIAYISYNVLPGWLFNQSMRDMILYRTRNIREPKQRVRAALGLFNIMLEGTAKGNSVHDVQLRAFGKTLKSFPDVSGYLLHEYMEADNMAFYFHKFAERLKNYGLKYICDADQADFELDKFPEDTASKFEKISENTIELEQYIDFFKNTRFRRSLLCHDCIDINSEYRLDRIHRLFAATDVVPVLDSPESTLREAITFQTLEGRRFTTQHKLAQIILRKLSEAKSCTIPVTSLIGAVASKNPIELDHDAGNQAEKIGHAIYALFFNGVVELLGAGRRCILNAGDFPTASAVSRLMAPTHRVTNLCHRTIVMDDDMACFVLAHLDGTRNRNALQDLMEEGIHTGQVWHPKLKAGSVKTDRESIRFQLESILQQLVKCGVLIA